MSLRGRHRHRHRRGELRTDRKPFPADGLIPFLKPFYDYSWAVGLAVAFVLYGALTLTVGKKHVAAQTEG